MRITNNMMLRHASTNINGNKVNVDSLNSQMTSQKKIQRPSEDPVVAIRALRFRSTTSELTQYYENNIEDAEGWLETTETALTNIEGVLSSIRQDCEYAATGSLTTDDRNTILADLKKLREQIYAEGNTDYAGRSVFTGYRTNQTLTFLQDENVTYSITENLSYEDISSYNYYTNDLSMPLASAFSGTPTTAGEPSDPTELTYSRLRLSYSLGADGDGITGASAKVGKNASPDSVSPYSATNTSTQPTGINDYDANATTYPYGMFLSYTPAEGTAVASTIFAAAASTPSSVDFPVLVYDTMDAAMANSTNGELDFPVTTYAATSGNATSHGAIFIQETGELILSDGLSDEIQNARATLNVTYTKTSFQQGEVKPEYYFNCTKTTATGDVDYNKYDADGSQNYQDIDYMVAANQTLTVNTEASQVMSTAIGRDVDEMIDAMSRAIDAEQMVSDLEEMRDSDTAMYDTDLVERWLAAAEKERDYAEENVRSLYNTYIGNFDDYIEKVNLASTEVGSKGKSLELTKTRVSNQLTTVKELMSNNEDRDLSDIILDYTSAYTAYQASLQASATLNQTTLLNYL